MRHLLGRQSQQRVTGNDFGIQLSDKDTTMTLPMPHCQRFSMLVIDRTQGTPDDCDADMVRCMCDLYHIDMTQSSCNYEGARWAGQMGDGW